jgi:signal transduction histidine kinase
MKRLYISMVAAVLGALFIINWGLDKLVAKQGNEHENTELVVYQKLIDGFEKQLSNVNVTDLLQKANELAQYYQVKVSLESTDNIALPQSLLPQLSQPGGLLLASSADAYLLRKITLHPEALIHLQLPLMVSENEQENLLFTLILYLGICGIILLWLLPLTRRLYLLTFSAAKIGAGDLSIRVPYNRFSYINTLESSFNNMAARIEKLVADNKILARSISHDIRTPMSCLRFGVEAALDCDDLTKKNNYLSRMEVELTRMEDMTTAFLDYAGMERQSFHLKPDLIDVNNLIEVVTNDCQSLAEQHNIKLSCERLATEKFYSLDFHWCYRAVLNLVSNAIQHADSKVILSIEINNQAFSIAVEDDGKGIPKDKRDVIFSPFIKLDSSRSREQGHFGLGLAISAKVMDWHQGRINADAGIILPGARFSLLFPAQTNTENVQ